ncbi:MAG: hypothetical protein IJS46_06135, partial [Kiritimatiellae bacterium]|nr:hypothetical protein [Kiritimatiellia bacterium]
AGDGYVWFWGEKNCWGDWGESGPNPARGIDPRPWREALPGLEGAILAVKDPEAYAKRCLSCATQETAAIDLAAFAPWQHDKARKGRLWRDETFGEGDTFSLAAEGCEDGAFSHIVEEPLVAGDRLLVRVSMHGEGGCARFCWRRSAEKWDWHRNSSVVLRFGEPDACGWRHAEAVVRIPESVAGAGLILSARQLPHQVCHFDNVEIIPLARGGDF